MTAPSASPHSLCPKCGAGLEAGARFCGECGARLEVSLAQPLPSAPPAPTKVAPSAAPPVERTPSPAADPRALASKAYAKARSVDRLAGRTLNGRYLVEKKIGEGGFGAVFRGKQLATGRDVALKILHPHNVSDATVVARFRREAEACSKLRDPHTVITYDFDETEDGVLFLAMELLSGKSLQQVQKAEGTLDPLRVLDILDQVGQALGEAHRQGIVHRDMKPENVMIESRDGKDLVKVLDFGIAKIVSGDASSRGPALTAIGQTVGTLEFMSPEQLRGKALDGRSDIYALGMMTYEMLTGALPFKDAKSSTEVIEFHLHKQAPPPSQLRPDLAVPAFVDEVVLKMVAKRPEDRHATVEELREHIAKVLASADGATRRKEVFRLAAVVGGLVLVVALAVILLSR
ncbi:MAG: serine/threonine-protein kinase [Deltaproteobacteria bacterium]|nr:serine/threonine-protein kinase [Deltaproteobacteria bacterium]